MSAPVSDAELAAFIASLQPPTAAAAEPQLVEPEHPDVGPWFAANYRGSCAGCGTRFSPGEEIRADGELGWLARCCGRVEQDTAAAAVDELAPAAPAGPPPSTLRELRKVLIDFDASRPRSMQKELGPSELGTPCQQQIARKLVGAPRQPTSAPPWAPLQGTAVHASMEDVVAFWNGQLGRTRWLAEDRLTVVDAAPGYPAVEGNGDAFDTDYGMVVDWKLTGKTARDKLRNAKRAGKPAAEQVSAEYRVQAHLYGMGHANKGRDVRHVRLVLLARSHDFDESEEWTEPYNEGIALAAIDRYWATVDLVASLGGPQAGDLIAAVQATPNRDACKWCPFHTPGQPTGWAGCAGDRTPEKHTALATAGLIEDSGAAAAPAAGA
jgi:hypothetical protein